MPKVILDRTAFKALASDTRLEILRTLDKKKMSLSEISRITDLNKATLHEHLSKLIEAGLVNRKSRPGHKWVYYQLSWKGESLLHPENTKIVVTFVTAVLALCIGISQMYLFLIGTYKQHIAPNGRYSLNQADDLNTSTILNKTNVTPEYISVSNGDAASTFFTQDPVFLYLGIIFIAAFIILVAIAVWYRQKNITPKL